MTGVANHHTSDTGLRPFIVDGRGKKLDRVPEAVELNPELLSHDTLARDTFEGSLGVLDGDLDAAHRVMQSHDLTLQNPAQDAGQAGGAA